MRIELELWRVATLEALEAQLQAMGVNGQNVVLEGLGGIDDESFLGAGESRCECSCLLA
jgi:hypothetical protein